MSDEISQQTSLSEMLDFLCLYLSKTRCSPEPGTRGSCQRRLCRWASLTTPWPLRTRSCTRRSVRSAMQFLTLVGRGLKLQVKQPTAVHAESSRSHLVITVTLATAASPCGPSGRPSTPGQCPR